jgi:hypothetical protein
MNIVEKAELHFHKQDQLSVYLESNSSNELEKVGEIGLLTMFALRILSNLGQSQEADSVARFLFRFEECGIVAETGGPTGGLELIGYPGYEGRYRFYGSFELRDQEIRFDMEPKGFGVLGTGLGYYAPMAVLGLCRHLATKRSSDGDYLRRLRVATCACGVAHIRREIGLANQVQLGGRVIMSTCGDLLFPNTQEKNARLQPTADSSPQEQTVASEAKRVKVDETLPDTIRAEDPRYEALGREFDGELHRSDGASVAKSLHARLVQDMRDWLCDRVWPYFTCLPDEQWPRQQAIRAELDCGEVVAVFQSVRGAAAGIERGYVPPHTTGWYRDWLLRLNVGESAGKQVSEVLSSPFEGDPCAQSQMLAAAMSKGLPRIPNQLSLLQLYARTLDIRVQATTATAFGDEADGQRLHAEAVSLEENISTAIERFWSGGGVVYVLAGDQGPVTTILPGSPDVLEVWMEADYAKEMSEQKFGGTYRVSPIDYRRFELLLKQVQSAGIPYVTLHRRLNSDLMVVPIDLMLSHIREKINEVESTPLGKALKQTL